MSTYAQTSSLHQACDRSYYLLTCFAVSATTRDLRAFAETALMAGKDVAKIIFAGNDPKHLDFLLDRQQPH